MFPEIIAGTLTDLTQQEKELVKITAEVEEKRRLFQALLSREDCDPQSVCEVIVKRVDEILYLIQAINNPVRPWSHDKIGGLLGQISLMRDQETAGSAKKRILDLIYEVLIGQKD